MWLHRSRRPRGGTTEAIRKLAESRAGYCAAEVVCLDAPAELYVQGRVFRCMRWGPARGGYCYTPRSRPWLEENLQRFDGVVIHGLWQYHSYGTYRVNSPAEFLTLSFLTVCLTPTSSGLFL